MVKIKRFHAESPRGASILIFTAVKSLFFPFLLFISALASGLYSCRQKPAEGEAPQDRPVYNEKKLKDQFVAANRLQVQKESDEMDAYERSHGIAFTKTLSGVRYYVYKASASGDSIRKGMLVRLKYKLYLLDGTLCYSSDQDGVKEVAVEEGNLESGIHTGLQYLKRGDKALLMIPSHLAHGLLGDFRKIPPQMPILYDVEIQ